MNDPRILLETPEAGSKSLVLFLPGLSGGAKSERFAPLARACIEKGFSIARIELWENAEDVKLNNLEELKNELSRLVEQLKNLGCEKFFAVGKSFGGGLWLTIFHPAIDARVLWAPATIAAKVNFDELKNINTPVCVLRGTADQSIPLEDSKKLVTLLSNAEIVPIEGADHSFKNPEHEKVLIAETLGYLNKIRN